MRRGRGVCGSMIGCALLLSAVGCGDEAAPEGPPAAARQPVVVALRRAAVEPVADRLTVSGSVEPWQRASPGAKVLGRVVALAVEEGEPVKAGETLLRLDDRDLAAAVAQARAAVAVAEARRDNADAQAARVERLFDRGSATAKEREDATAARRVAVAAVDQAEAALEAAEVTLADATVASPFAGWVVARHVEVGDMVRPGEPLLTVEALDPAKAVVEVPELELAGLAVGGPAAVAVDAVGGRFAAEIDRIVPAGDPASHTFAVQLLLPNPDGALKSGMFLRASFSRGTRDALFVPAAAVVTRGQLEGIFVVEGGRARLRWVRTGERRQEAVEILSGMSDGEAYVAAPPPGLVDGAPVREAG